MTKTIEQLQARVAELEESRSPLQLSGVNMSHVTSAFSWGSFAVYGDYRSIKAAQDNQHDASLTEYLRSRVAELEAEKREFQLEAQGQIEFLDKKLLLAQADSKRLRYALDTAVKGIMVFRNEPYLERLHKLRSSDGYGVMQNAMDCGLEALAHPTDTSALDAFVAEKVKEAMK